MSKNDWKWRNSGWNRALKSVHHNTIIRVQYFKWYQEVFISAFSLICGFRERKKTFLAILDGIYIKYWKTYCRLGFLLRSTGWNYSCRQFSQLLFWVGPCSYGNNRVNRFPRIFLQHPKDKQWSFPHVCYNLSYTNWIAYLRLGDLYFIKKTSVGCKSKIFKPQNFEENLVTNGDSSLSGVQWIPKQQQKIGFPSLCTILKPQDFNLLHKLFHSLRFLAVVLVVFGFTRDDHDFQNEEGGEKLGEKIHFATTWEILMRGHFCTLNLEKKKSQLERRSNVIKEPFSRGTQRSAERTLNSGNSSN